MKAVELKHPLIEHKLAILRDKKTGTKEFREIISEIATILCYESMRDAKMNDAELEVFLTKVYRSEEITSIIKALNEKLL
jgi:uracil phosphoribosyltransferase